MYGGGKIRNCGQGGIDYWAQLIDWLIDFVVIQEYYKPTSSDKTCFRYTRYTLSIRAYNCIPITAWGITTLFFSFERESGLQVFFGLILFRNKALWLYKRRHEFNAVVGIIKSYSSYKISFDHIMSLTPCSKFHISKFKL